jgi:putative transposase
MAAGAFRVGNRFIQNGSLYRVARNIGGGVLAIEDLSAGRFLESPIADLLDAWAKGDLVFGDRPPPQSDEAVRNALRSAQCDAFLQSYSEAEQEQAKAKLAYVTGLESLPRSASVMTPVIAEIGSDSKLWKGTFSFARVPHFTTVAKWIRIYQDADRDIRALIDRHRDKGNTDDRYHPVVIQIVEDLVETRYLTPERPTITSILKDLKGMVALQNVTRLQSEKYKTPSYGYLKRRIAELPPYDVCKARFGQRAADIKFRFAGAGVSALRPLARACMDHSRMDVFVIDERTGLPLGRPWLTMVIDEYTRYILGYYLSFEDPSSVSMTRALRHALSPKAPSPDVKAAWDAWGIMDVLVVDNGMEFHSRALEAGAGRFGITIQFCPRRKPWYKGKVERFFGTLNTGLLVDMKGKTFSSILLKGDYDPAKHAVMTLKTLRRVVHMWVVDIYHQEGHGGLDDRLPSLVWDESVSEIDRFLPPSSLVLESAFSKSDKRRLTHKGIEFDSLFYNSAELGALRQMHGHEIDVEVRSYDDELGSIVVVEPDGKTLVKVPALDQDYAAGLTRWQHRVCRRYRARVLDEEARQISLLDARNRIRDLIKQDMALGSRKTRKNQQRFVQNDRAPAETETEAGATPDAQANKDVAIEAQTAECAATPIDRARKKKRAAAEVPALNADLDDVPAFASRKVAGRAK